MWPSVPRGAFCRLMPNLKVTPQIENVIGQDCTYKAAVSSQVLMQWVMNMAECDYVRQFVIITVCYVWHD